MTAAETVPRVLVVSRRHVRKGKYVDVVGEYHLNLVLEYGAVPVIVPRVKGILEHLHQFEPFHGLLLVEGEDVHPESYGSSYTQLSPEERARVEQKYSGDTAVDVVKDKIELELIRRCIKKSIPILSICRGSQILNAACGGELFLDIETQLGDSVIHYDGDNYDSHRHPILIEQNTPMDSWFGTDELMVNSYHHCGVKRLAPRFRAMARAPDGLVEAFYDPSSYSPSCGLFTVGLQFHPERMQDMDAHIADRDAIFDQPGCKAPYEAFARAAKAYAGRSEHRDRKAIPASFRSLHRIAERNTQPWRAHMTVHGSTVALSLLHEGIECQHAVDTEFVVADEDVKIRDGVVVVDLTDPINAEERDRHSSASREIISAEHVSALLPLVM
eukprot:Plantae.Rhodophyta-Purpureofilum_apyrenoidigerum.ctg18927.p1 GENE.Plantae.Rhodophyta-Purpureofilum_apyrenoidigerum.ctg18927~~Plantae.Rhodophyta-Purpureofilum_apyrenoidigerum.ctg18927.p1  ORF type:complete len:386 (-),score=54.05 Plantae.Rhodophyta-Purpureofilum_apyrenoidigerum.ctg18927:437-1594(-)